VIENFKVGGLARYGLGYDDLRKVNPALIYCSITGFGQTGPYKDRAGYDLMIQGMGGQHVDLALLDVQVSTLANQAMDYLTTGIAPERLGNAHPNIQ
jgi:crotonobetainyl-CoA:carnitine CoA-transferase CaiB-like acyl-CoA transferase